MAVPASGELSLLGIKRELENNNYTFPLGFSNISLEDLSDGTVATINTSNNVSDRPDGSAPHAMSEFYNYDHDLSGLGDASGLSVQSQTTTAVTFVYTEGANSDRTIVQLTNYNGSTSGLPATLNISGFAGSFPNQYQSVDGSGTSTFTVTGGTSTFFLGGIAQNVTLAANDFVSLKVQSGDGSSTGTLSSQVTGYTLPGVPTSLGTTSISSHAMTIGWTAPTGGVNASNGYRYYHGTNSTATNNSAVDTGNTSVALTGLNANTTYYWTVQGKNGGGTFGSTATQVAISTAPDAISGGITATPTINSINLSWSSHPAGTSEYRLYFGTNSTVTDNSTSTVNVSKTQTNITGLTTSQTYYWGIQPRNSDGNYGDLVTGSTTTLAQATYTFHYGSTTRGWNGPIANLGTHTTTKTGVGTATSTMSDMIRVVIANGNAAAVTITTNNPTPSGLGSYQFLASDTESDVSGTNPSGTFQALSHSFSLGNYGQGGVTTYYFRVKWNHGSMNLLLPQQTSDAIAVTTTNTGASPSSMAINLVVKVTP